MIPLQDDTRRPSHLPVVTVLLILANALVFALELSAGDPFVERWSVVPAEIMGGHRWATLVTAMFMHGSWSHIIGNMVFLWAFGPEIEDVMNPRRYLVFYLVGGMAAMLAQIAADPASTIPNLGASGAIAAVMGAFIVTFPRDSIRTLLIFGWYIRVTVIPAGLLIGFWFVTQLVSFGAISDVQSGGIAYLAHIGGFAFGALSARLFEVRSRLEGPRGGPWG